MVLLFTALLPLRIEHFLANIQLRTFGVVGNAVQERGEKLFSRYMINRVFPGVRDCGSVVNVGCNAYDPGRGKVANLYRNWSNAKLEQRLFTDNGIDIEYTPSSGRYVIKSPTGASLDVDGETFNLTQLRETDRNGIARLISDQLDNETFYKRLLLRSGVRKLADSKWNVDWCLRTCTTKNKVNDFIDSRLDSLTKLKIRIAEATISPFSDRLGLYMTCIMSNCSDIDFITERSRLANKFIEELGEDALKEIVDDIGNSRSLTQFLVKKTFTKLFGTTAGKAAAYAVPVVGWVYLIDTIDQVDTFFAQGTISKYISDSIASQYAEFYLTMVAHRDEGRDGQLSLEEYGAYARLLEGGQQSLVYQNEFGTAASEQAVRASNGQDQSYLCADGNPVPEGEVICPERMVSQSSALDRWRQNPTVNSFATGILSTYRCTLFALIDTVLPTGYSPENCTSDSLFDKRSPFDEGAHAIFAAFEGLLSNLGDTLISTIESLPYGEEIIGYITEKAEQIAFFFLEQVFPNIFAGQGEPRQVFDDLYAGADVVSNDFAKGYEDPVTGQTYGLGAGRLTDEEVQELRRITWEEERIRFEDQSLFARLFSPEEENSLLTHIAIRSPEPSKEGLVKTIASIFNIEKQFKMVGTSLAFTFGDAYAQQAPVYKGSYFGVIQHGYAANDPILDIDPELLTDEACSPGGVFYDAWKEGIYGDEADEPTTDGQPYSTVSNPCLLEDVTTNVLGCWFTEDDDCGVGLTSLTFEDQVVESTQNLAQQILDIVDSGGRLSFGSTNSCPTSCVREPFERLAQGELANITASNTTKTETTVDERVLAILIALNQQGFPSRITALTTGEHSPTSQHYDGKAVDIGSIDELDRSTQEEVMKYLFDNRQSLGVYELFYDAFPEYTINNGQPSGVAIGGHSGHLHIGVSP
jgi:hypothetical protein